MNKVFTNKSILQKMTIILISLLLFNFAIPQSSQASSFGGKLFKPLIHLVGGIGDIAMGGLQKFMLGTSKFQSFILEADDKNIKTNMKTDVYYKYNNEEKKWEEISEGDDYAKNDIVIDGKTLEQGWFEFDSYYEKDKVKVPNALYTPEAIFANKIAALDVNFIKPNKYSPVEGSTTANKSALSSAEQLQGVISKWYYAFRNIALVGLLSVLVYIGIRIMLSSTSSEKAKYKERIMDWIVAICLLFFLHYIMSFTLVITEEVTNMISQSVDRGIDVKVTNSTFKTEDESGNSISLLGFKTNMMGYCRFMTQSDDIFDVAVYTILYLVLVIYTLMFTFTYFKRLLYMAFLTMIAPLVALTYPLDKISDGKAQAFNMWLREYMFNAIIQPVHLLLYITLIGTSMDLAVNNPIYAIVAMGFLLPAEKFIKSMFGFDKAKTPGGLGMIAGGALTMNAIKQISSIGKSVKGGSSNNKIDSNDNDKVSNPGIRKRNETIDDIVSNNSNQGGLLAKGGGTPQKGGGTPPKGGGTPPIGGGIPPIGGGIPPKGGGIPPIRGGTPPSKMRRIGRGIYNGAVAVAGKNKRALQRRFTGKNIRNFAGRNIRKAAFGALGATTLGTLGLAAGIATGNLGNAAQNTLVAATIGGSLANNLGDGLADKFTMDQRTFKDAYEQEAYTEAERNERAQKEFNKQFKLDENNVRVLESKFGAIEANKIMNGTSDTHMKLDDFLEAGIDDAKLIAKTMDMQRKEGISEQRALQEAAIANELDKDTFTNVTKARSFREELREKGISDADRADLERRLKKMLK